MVRLCGENEGIVKRVFVGEYAGSHSVGKLRKRWVDTVKDCLRKRGLDVTQARRMVQDKSEWQWNAWGVAWRDEPLTFSILSFASLLMSLISWYMC